MALLLSEIRPEGKVDISRQQHIPHVIEREHAEDDVIERTHARQTAQIQDALAQRQTMVNLVDTAVRKKPKMPGTAKGLSVGWK